MHGPLNVSYICSEIERNKLNFLNLNVCRKTKDQFQKAGIARSVKPLATSWTVWGSNPAGGGGARFSSPVQAGSGTHTASYTIGTGSLPGVKRPGHGVAHTLPSRAEIKERVEE
jgi:hypothetical protein